VLVLISIFKSELKTSPAEKFRPWYDQKRTGDWDLHWPKTAYLDK
jgi:hypothetical protein